MAVQATLDGYPLLGSSDVRWELRSGVRPYETEVDMRPEDAEKILAESLRPLSLVVSDGRGRTVKIQGVYALLRGVGENPHVSRVLLADRRWFWPHTRVVRQLNVPRVVGTKHQRAPDTPPELQPLDVKVSYWPATLKHEEELWTATDVLENVLGQLQTVEGAATGAGAGFRIDPSLGNLLSNLPVHDVQLDDQGDAALARVLAYLPEAEVFVDRDGVVVAYSRATGLEFDEVHGAGAESVGGGHVEWISQARIRPSKIHVLFTREHEVRFDFYETATPTRTDDERYIDNVLPVPDYQLTLRRVNGEAGDTVSQGTWIDFPTAFQSWGAPPGLSNLTSASAWYAFVRRAQVPFLDAWAGILLSGARVPKADWASRVSAIQTHFRRTFRVSPRWMARIWQLKAVKVATLDPVTGTRAPALAYADHARMPSQRAFYSGQDFSTVINVRSSPASAFAEPPGPAAPADVSIADHDQGIIHLDFRPDIYRLHEMILPSMVELEGSGRDANGYPLSPGPTTDLNDVSAPICFNALGESHKPPQLTSDHRVAVVVTAIPVGDNGFEARHLHRVTVEPGDVVDLLPKALRAGITDSRGPELTIRIPATIETARVAWVLDRAQDIERSFGVNPGEAAFDIEDLVVNLEGDAEGGASLKAIAYAAAAQIWATMTDRTHGEKTVRLSEDVDLVGSMQSVAYVVRAQTGATETEIALPEKLKQIDLFSILPDSTRRIVLRLAPSPGKQS